MLEAAAIIVLTVLAGYLIMKWTHQEAIRDYQQNPTIQNYNTAVKGAAFFADYTSENESGTKSIEYIATQGGNSYNIVRFNNGFTMILPVESINTEIQYCPPQYMFKAFLEKTLFQCTIVVYCSNPGKVDKEKQWITIWKVGKDDGCFLYE